MAMDAGYIQFEAALDLTGSNTVAMGTAMTNLDVFEIGILFLTASSGTAPAVYFNNQTTASASAPSPPTTNPQFATVTASAAANAAGTIVKKSGLNERITKGSRLWAVVKTTTTGASRNPWR